MMHGQKHIKFFKLYL